MMYPHTRQAHKVLESIILPAAPKNGTKRHRANMAQKMAVVFPKFYRQKITSSKYSSGKKLSFKEKKRYL